MLRILSIYSNRTVIKQSYIYILITKLIGASLSEPHHMGSTVKSVFLLACTVKIPVYGRKPFKCKPTLHQTLQALHKTRGVLTIARTIKC